MTYRIEETIVKIADYSVKTGIRTFIIDDFINISGIPRNITIRQVKQMVGTGYLKLADIMFTVQPSLIERADEIKESARPRTRIGAELQDGQFPY